MKGFDFEKAIQYLSKDKTLKSLIDIVDLPERTPAKEVYPGLIQSIVSQQLSVKAAATIHGRFLNLFDTEFPDPKTLLALEDKELRAVGLSGQKTRYVKNVASFFQDRDLFHKDWTKESNEEIISLLTEIKGVGKWTVEMILMFVLSREDVLTVLDLGIQQGIKRLYGISAEKKELYAQMEKIAEPWRPYRSIACLYLWESKEALENK